MSAEARLAKADPKLGKVIARVVKHHGPQKFVRSPAKSHFEALSRSIIFQQLSGKAAGTIYGRYEALFRGGPTPAKVRRAKPELLRSAGLSTGKAKYVQALATAVDAGSLDLEHISSLEDDPIVEALTEVNGIGVWTAQMFLMFRLLRPNVLPTGDLGVRKGLTLAHRLRELATPAQVEKAGARWAPDRSLACLYLWASLDLALP
jgi:DNA-3-methyladenine glycosylase II